MPFRSTFECLWCGRAHGTRGPDDLEGFAQLCPECLGRAQDNGFLRSRLRAALSERSAALVVPASVAPPDRGAEVLAYDAARAPESDDRYLRRGRHSHGPLSDMAWQMDLDQATLWLDGLPIAGHIVELAAGTGWWSPLLAQKGELSLYDALEEPLERARQRLVAHGLRAHLHTRDAWAEPDRQVDALFTGFWLSLVPRARLGEFLALARRWLKPGGIFAFIDSRSDPSASAVDGPTSPGPDPAHRTLSDGGGSTIPAVFHEPGALEEALRAAGFTDATVTTTSRFFLLGSARA